MNRRTFLATGTAVAFTPFFLSTQGCGASTIAELVQVLGNSASQIAALEGNTSLASKLLTDTGAAVTAIDNWKTGSPTAEVIEVLNIVMDDLSLFPITGPYVPLIDLAIGTVEAILALLPASSGISAAAVKPHVQHRTVTLTNPPKTASQYKKQFNAIVAANPAIKVSKLQ